jgi:hypothetical protein
MRAAMKGLVGLAVVVLPGCASTPGMMNDTGMAMAAPSPTRAVELRQTMRSLWADHVIWTRQYIVAAAADDPSAQAAAARLMKNQEEIGAAVGTYYGDAAGTRLTSLLKQHIQIATELVAAAKGRDAARQQDADARWHRNAEDIATLLSGANPNWPHPAVLDMLNQHLTLTTQEAVSRLQHRWPDDVAAFDRIYDQAMSMADTLADGIVRQFPQRF